MELQGVRCHDLKLTADAKKGMAVTRSFGAPMTELHSLLQAIAMHAARGGEKLRQEGLVAGSLTAFTHTNYFSNRVPQYRAIRTVTLFPPTQDTRELVSAASAIIKQAYKPGFQYVKAGILLNDLSDQAAMDVPLMEATDPRSTALMTALDAVNSKYGRHTLRLALMGYQHPWKVKAAHRSPAYTTKLSEVVRVRAY